VDRPEPLPTKKPKKKIRPVSESDKKRAQKFIEKVTETMSSRQYLESRPPEYLASEIKFVAVLLLSALRENWIIIDDFFDATHRIWSKLFFTSEVNRTTGWIEHRCKTADSPEELIDRMATVELSATLAAWAINFLFDFSTIDKARFSLSCIISVARLPRLWKRGSPEQIARELEKDSLQKLYFGKVDSVTLDAFSRYWLRLIRLGKSMEKFENEIGDIRIADIKGLIDQNYVSRGELLWQGTLGFCLASKDCNRSQRSLAHVISLHDASKKTEISPEFLIPVRALISEKIIPTSENFNDEHRRYIETLIDDIKEMLMVQK
jgi:hypothetical protein